jgi:hypothetical protein
MKMKQHHETDAQFLKKRAVSLILCFTLCGMIICSGCSGSTGGYPWNENDSEPVISADDADGSLSWLSWMMDRYHSRLDVYTDANAAGNHFPMRGRMPASADDYHLPPMNDQWMENPHSGRTCIQATFIPSGDSWGGWYFMNGVLDGGTAPVENWGDFPDAGVDLTGATCLTFWARGEKGGERVKYFMGGIGLPSEDAQGKPYPDSSSQLTTGWVTLTPEWKEYSIPCGNQDLRSVLGGFGWVSSYRENDGHGVVFYLDDITYDRPRLEDPRFLVSYKVVPSDDAFDEVLSNVGFTYDNALAILAYLARGEPDDIRRARIIADALVYAQDHDRFHSDGRLRNGYQGGDIALPQGWYSNGKAGTVRMPGWYNLSENQWFEDKYQVSSDTGNQAWAMLSLSGVYEATKDERYLNASERLGAWIEEHCADDRGTGGYTAGYTGWEGNTTKLLYKSTEHNLDLYAAYSRLARNTGDDRWREDAEKAKAFVLSMWDDEEGKFFTGTAPDGVTMNRDVIPLDCQTWMVLSLKDVLTWDQKARALRFAEEKMRVGEGYSFGYSYGKDLTTGVWYEGTGQMALACRETGLTNRSEEITNFLDRSARNGALYATDGEKLYTGFENALGDPWYYYHRKHVGATAWKILAEEGMNPFRMREE